MLLGYKHSNSSYILFIIDCGNHVFTNHCHLSSQLSAHPQHQQITFPWDCSVMSLAAAPTLIHTHMSSYDCVNSSLLSFPVLHLDAMMYALVSCEWLSSQAFSSVLCVPPTTLPQVTCFRQDSELQKQT